MEGKRRNKEKVKDNNIEKKDENISQDKTVRKIKNIFVMIIWIIVLISIIYQIAMLGLYTIGKVEKSKVPLYTAIDNIVTKYYPKYFETEEKYSINLSALGNIYTSKSIEYQYKNQDLDKLLINVKDSIKDSDLVIANLKINESSKSTENFNINVINSFKKIGVDLFVTANENNFKKNKSSIDETNKIINDLKISQVGMSDNPYIFEQDNIKIGVLSYYLNLDKNEKAVEGKNANINYYTEENLKNDVKYLQDNNTDFIIAYLDYPNDDENRISLIQKQYAEKMLLSNVNAVFEVGSSAIKETYEDIYMLDGGIQNHGYVMYSLGDVFGIYEKEFNISTSGKIEFIKKIVKDNLGNVLEDKTIKYMIVNNPEIYYKKKDKTSINIYSLVNVLKTNDIDVKLKEEASDIIKEYKDVLNIKSTAKNEEKNN